MLHKRSLHLCGSLAILLNSAAFAQTYTVLTIAGVGIPNNIPGTSASLGFIEGVAVDPNGNVFMTSGTYHCVFRLDAGTGMLTVVAGIGIAGFSGDNGPAVKAQLNQPGGIALDTAGSIYVADTGNNLIRKISGGTITTVAGNRQAGLGGDGGAATSAELNQPAGVAVDGAGNLYIADTFNNRIREVSGGAINTLNFGSAVVLSRPQGIAVDAAGGVYFSDFFNVYRYSNGQLSFVVHSNGQLSSACPVGPANAAPFAIVSPMGIAVDSNGNVYIAEAFKDCIGEVSGGQLSAVAGLSTGGRLGDNGPAIQARVYFPTAVALDSAGNLYIGDSGNGRVRKVSGGIINTIAGGGTSGENGTAVGAQLGGPNGLAVSPSGSLYFADYSNARVGEVANGMVTTVAGTGIIGISPDGTPAGNAEFWNPSAVAFDNFGNYYVADAGASNVRKVSNGVLSTVLQGSFLHPKGVAVDATGVIYVSGSAGVLQVHGSTVTNVLPTNYAFGGLAMNAAGNLYVADPAENRILAVTSGGTLTVAGTGTAGFAGDGGPATNAQLSGPTAVAVDAAGNLYLADAGNSRIRIVSGGVITTIAGNGAREFDGDGAGMSLGIGSPQGIAADSAGNVYFSDSLDNLIRELVPATPACAVSVSPLNLTPPAEGGSFNITIQTLAGCPWAIQQLPAWISYSGGMTGTGPATVSLTVAANSGEARSTAVSIAGSLVTVAQAVNPTLPPQITPGGVVPIYSTGNVIQPGSWISIFGNNFAPTNTTWNGDFPQSLGGVSVTIDGKPAYLWYVSPTQINLQAPDDTNYGTVNVVVTTPNGSATSTVVLAPYAASFSLFDSTHSAGVIPTPDGSGAYGNGTYDLLGPLGAFSFKSRPVRPGETIELYGVGFGPTNPPVPAGAPFSGTAPLVSAATATVGGVAATVDYAGVTSAGLYQFNIVVPNFTAVAGDYPFLISIPEGPGVRILATALVSVAIQ